MAGTMKITRENVATCERAVAALREHLEKLAAMTRSYPVECTFAGYRYVFRTRQDIENTIAEIDRQIGAFKRAA